MYGMGENPLNGKGVPLTRNGEGGEIVWTSYEMYEKYIYKIKYICGGGEYGKKI